MEGKTGAKLLYAAALAALLPAAAMGQIPNCIPSCAPDDARFLAITGGGGGLETLTDTTLELQVRSPGGSFEIGFFDGESNGPGQGGLWDINSGAGQLTFELIADPAGDGSGTTLVAVFDGELMTDNDWTTFIVVDDAAAWSGSEYVYVLRAELTGVVGAVRSAFKVRTGADVFIEVFGQPFSFVAASPVGAREIIYPNNTCDFDLFPAGQFPGCLGESTYDGDFPFFLTARQPQQELLIWDGDLDRGNYDGTQLDTDDPNTANDINGLPPWACVDPTEPCDEIDNPALPGVNFEGVAAGQGLSTGNPPDDVNPDPLPDPFPDGLPGIGYLNLRPGAVSYEVWGPDGRLLATNDNPSGNREWELFRLAMVDDGQVDFVVGDLPAGIYEVRVKDLDLENLNAFRFNLPVGPEPSCDNGPDDSDSDSDSDSDDHGDSDSDSDQEVNRPTGLTFIYTGDPCGSDDANNNLQGGQPGTVGDYECTGMLNGDQPVQLVVLKKPDRFEVFPETFSVGDQVTFLALTGNKKLFSQVRVQIQDLHGTPLQEIRIHTSCSQPLRPGDQFGSLKLTRFHFMY